MKEHLIANTSNMPVAAREASVIQVSLSQSIIEIWDIMLPLMANSTSKMG